MLRIPEPVARPCQRCGQPTVLAEFPTGRHRVHCGTYRYECLPRTTRQRRPSKDLPHNPDTIITGQAA